MTKERLEEEYFDWLCHFIRDDIHFGRVSYETLLRFLHTIEFTYSIYMDKNRAEDGKDLRYRFARDTGNDYDLVETCLCGNPCSVFEMMVALAIRCEEHIMEDMEYGERTSQWFWVMVDSLGLGGMDDTSFNRTRAAHIIRRFLSREYRPNGKGGLFTIENCSYDLREVEIWYQLNYYLNSILED